MKAYLKHDPDLRALFAAEFGTFARREQQILQMRASGYGVTEIAQHLGTYRNDIYRVIWKAQAHLSQALRE